MANTRSEATKALEEKIMSGLAAAHPEFVKLVDLGIDTNMGNYHTALNRLVKDRVVERRRWKPETPKLFVFRITSKGLRERASVSRNDNSGARA